MENVDMLELMWACQLPMHDPHQACRYYRPAQAGLWQQEIEFYKRSPRVQGVSLHLSRHSVLSPPGRKVRKTSQRHCGAV
eukprot:223403-Chlamydomonas_euryale.AAC.1